MDTIKQYAAGALEATVALLEALPGLLAWLIEVLALIAAVSFIAQAIYAATLSNFYSAGMLLVLALVAVSVALSTDWYTDS